MHLITRAATAPSTTPPPHPPPRPSHYPTNRPLHGSQHPPPRHPTPPRPAPPPQPPAPPPPPRPSHHHPTAPSTAPSTRPHGTPHHPAQHPLHNPQHPPPRHHTPHPPPRPAQPPRLVSRFPHRKNSRGQIKKWNHAYSTAIAARSPWEDGPPLAGIGAHIPIKTAPAKDSKTPACYTLPPGLLENPIGVFHSYHVFFCPGASQYIYIGIHQHCSFSHLWASDAGEGHFAGLHNDSQAGQPRETRNSVLCSTQR